MGERFEALEDALAIVGGLFGGADPSHARRRGLVAARRPADAPAGAAPIPLWVGGKGGPRLLRLAARSGDRLERGVADRARGVRRASCDDVARSVCGEGRDPATFRRSVGLYGIAGATEDEARAAFERAKAGFPGDAMRDETWESWRADTLSGSIEQIRERADAFAALGVDGADRVAVGAAVHDARSPSRSTCSPKRLPAAMTPEEAVLRVLTEAEEPLHWTVIQDRALRAGYLDPFETPDVRAAVLRRPSRAAVADGRVHASPRPASTRLPRLGPVVDRGEALELLEAVVGLHVADRAGARAHHHRVRRGAVGPVPHALEQVAVGDARRREEHVVARGQVVGVEHLVEVEAVVEQRPALLVVARVELALDRAAQALERGGRR